MLQYPEVYTDLRFCSVLTLPLELRCGKKIITDTARDGDDENVTDGTYTTSIPHHIRQQKNDLPQWRKHTQSEILIMNDLKQSKMGYDKVTQFSLRPLELKPVIDMTGHYYRWFNIDMSTKISSEDMNNCIHPDLHQTMWIDALQRQVKMQKTAIREVIEWCNEIETENFIEGRIETIQLFRRIHKVLTIDDIDELDEDDRDFLDHANENLLFHDDKQKHLPICSYSYVTSTNFIQFINHILSSMGRSPQRLISCYTKLLKIVFVLQN